MKLHVLSMLVAAAFTAGAMTIGQSFASNAETPEYGFGSSAGCNLNPGQLTPEQIANRYHTD